jgi:hypothetical protein
MLSFTKTASEAKCRAACKPFDGLVAAAKNRSVFDSEGVGGWISGHPEEDTSPDCSQSQKTSG